MAVKSLAQSSILQPSSTNSMLGDYESNYFHHLETVRLSSTAASVTFSNLAQYSDFEQLQLRLVLSGSSSYESNIRIRFNGDTGAYYKSHYLVGAGSAIYGDTKSETSGIYSYYMDAGSLTSEFGSAIIDLLEPFNSTKFTTLKMLSGAARSSTARVALTSGLWTKAEALNSIEFVQTGGTFRSGSRFCLYGFKARS